MIDDLRPGTRLRRYQLLLPIGRGGMAAVWVARVVEPPDVGRWVAVKVMLPGLLGDPELDKMFVDEGRLAARIHHPNVVEVFEVGAHERTPFICMEWIEGESLHALLTQTARRRTITPAIAVSLVARVAGGLHGAHCLAGEDGKLLGVVHRDVSPHNILISVDGAVKLVDFGVAKARGRLADSTSAGQLKGKFGYMSPEQATDRPIDRRSDIFSLGIVLFELTTGRRLFRGRNDAETLRLVTSAEIPSPTRIVRHYPERLERIVLKALQRDPMRRYQSASALQRDLEAYVERAHAPIEARHVALLLEQVLGERIRQRRAKIEEAEQALSGTAERLWAPTVRAPSGVAEVAPESSRTVLNSSGEIVVPARSTLGYAAALGAGALLLAAGLAASLRISRVETLETAVRTLGRASVSAPSLEGLRAPPRAAPRPREETTQAGAGSCGSPEMAVGPLPSTTPNTPCRNARALGAEGAKVRLEVR